MITPNRKLDSISFFAKLEGDWICARCVFFCLEIHFETNSGKKQMVSLILLLSCVSKLTPTARVVHSTSYSDVTSRGRPNLGPYVIFPDVLIRPGVRRTSFVRPIRPRRIRTSGKHTYGPKLGRPLDVRGRHAEWEF